MSLQSATNVFVVCLAVSDLALCLFSLPVQLHYQLTDNWYFGSALCRVVFAAFAVPMYLSTVTVMLIAVDRFETITVRYAYDMNMCMFMSFNVNQMIILLYKFYECLTLNVE